MAQMDLPLLELVAEDLKRGWTRFEFVAVAKEWDAAKQLAVIPALLRGKLIDYYVELDDATKKDWGQHSRRELERRRIHWLHFTQRNQREGERVSDFASSLKQLFKTAFPQEAMTSAVLLQRFLTGLRSEISRQLLLRQKPADFTSALKDAMDIERALEFCEEEDSIHAISRTQPPQHLTPLPYIRS